MSIFKRLSSTVTASIDQVVGEIENHDAVIEATIADLKKKIAEANVRHDRVRREANALKKQIEQSTKDASRWRERAMECAKDDEHKAIACVQRARQCEAQAEQLKDSHEQYQQTTDKLSRDIQTAENRAREMKQKHSLMRARQSSTAAIASTQDSKIDVVTELDDTFDRWEMKLRKTEIMHDNVDNNSYDSLEQAFIEQEEADDLRDELNALLNQDEKS